jgi:hypothetical protein
MSEPRLLCPDKRTCRLRANQRHMHRSKFGGVVPGPRLLQADQHQPADDENGCRDARGSQRLLEDEDRDNGTEQNAGLA